MNPNIVARYLGKDPEKFTRSDLIRFIGENNIEMLNLRYVDADAGLRTLNFVITGEAQLDRLLSNGERADGSSIFPYFNVTASDLYIIPRYRSAFVNPFSSIPSLDILCSLFYRDGQKLEISNEYILKKAHDRLKVRTGFTLEAMGELEYYVISGIGQNLYIAGPQKGYHQSAPFAYWEQLRIEAMRIIVQIGGKVKYGHSEVGYFISDGLHMEQHEIEFEPQPLEDSADQLTLAKWVLRMLGQKYNLTISFAPKVHPILAGNGLHIHSRLMKNGTNAMVKSGKLNDNAKSVIAGYLELAPSLNAFGNTVPLSYLRLVPGQEAPTNICWGERNRNALIRVPLGWLAVPNMTAEVNPLEKRKHSELTSLQTIEFRSPDGSANIYLLLAGLAVAARFGLETGSLARVEKELYAGADQSSRNGRKGLRDRFPQLPGSCLESAEQLIRHRKLYERDGVFPSHVIDGIANKLKHYNDKNLRKKLKKNKAVFDELLNKYLHCG